MSAERLVAALAGKTERQYQNEGIVRSLCDSIRDAVIARSADWPEGWDGHEMRQLLALKFSFETTDLLNDGRSTRRREFDHERINRNL